MYTGCTNGIVLGGSLKKGSINTVRLLAMAHCIISVIVLYNVNQQTARILV